MDWRSDPAIANKRKEVLGMIARQLSHNDAVQFERQIFQEANSFENYQIMLKERFRQIQDPYKKQQQPQQRMQPQQPGGAPPMMRPQMGGVPASGPVPTGQPAQFQAGQMGDVMQQQRLQQQQQMQQRQMQQQQMMYQQQQQQQQQQPNQQQVYSITPQSVGQTSINIQFTSSSPQISQQPVYVQQQSGIVSAANRNLANQGAWQNPASPSQSYLSPVGGAAASAQSQEQTVHAPQQNQMLTPAGQHEKVEKLRNQIRKFVEVFRKQSKDFLSDVNLQKCAQRAESADFMKMSLQELQHLFDQIRTHWTSHQKSSKSLGGIDKMVTAVQEIIDMPAINYDLYRVLHHPSRLARPDLPPCPPPKRARHHPRNYLDSALLSQTFHKADLLSELLQKEIVINRTDFTITFEPGSNYDSNPILFNCVYKDRKKSTVQYTLRIEVPQEYPEDQISWQFIDPKSSTVKEEPEADDSKRKLELEALTKHTNAFTKFLDLSPKLGFSRVLQTYKTYSCNFIS